MKLYQCDKTVLRFFPKGAEFVKAYTTNVVEAPRNVFTDIHGKIIAVVDQQKLSEDEVLVIVETKFVDRLVAHLKNYLFLSETRAECLETKKVYWDIEYNELIVSDEELEATATEAEFTKFRIAHGIPLQGVDFDQEMVLNVVNEGYISYDKGCYLGQEIVARVHYRSMPPKRLVVKKEADCSAEQRIAMTSKVIDAQSGQAMGFVFDKTAPAV